MPQDVTEQGHRTHPKKCHFRDCGSWEPTRVKSKGICRGSPSGVSLNCVGKEVAMNVEGNPDKSDLHFMKIELSPLCSTRGSLATALFLCSVVRQRPMSPLRQVVTRAL